MANPNIVAVTSIYGNTTYYTPSGTTAVVLLPNAASSGLVYKIDQIVVANVNGSSAANATVSVYTNGAVAQGSAPSGGTAYSLLSTVVVPYNSSLVAIDKASSFYLQEGTSVIVTSSTASKLVYVVSYEDMT